MAAQYKTKCPHCGAQFKIGQDHLKQAGGKVRCGSCLEIFLATENLVKEGAQAPAKPAKQAKPGNAPAKPKKPAKKQPAPASKQKPTASDEPRWTPPKQDDGKKQQGKPAQKKGYESNDTGVSLGSSELSDSFLSMDEGAGFGDDFVEAREGSRGESDESWAEQLLEELEDDEEPRKADQAAPPTPENMSLLDEWPGDEDAIAQTAAPEPGPEDGDGMDMFAEDMGATDDDLDIIEIPPPEEETASVPRLKLPRDGQGAGQWFKWSAFSLLAALVLAGQYLAFNFGELARDPQWRPHFASACELIGCPLPHPSSLADLRGANLVVRDHPTVAGALVVDAILFNEANYPQPFPVLELSFSSVRDQPIASRRFTPSEYRAGELKDLTHMPPGVPVHISLEILNPGAEAVNYSLRFRPAPRPENAG